MKALSLLISTLLLTMLLGGYSATSTVGSDDDGGNDDVTATIVSVTLAAYDDIAKKLAAIKDYAEQAASKANALAHSVDKKDVAAFFMILYVKAAIFKLRIFSLATSPNSALVFCLLAGSNLIVGSVLKTVRYVA